MDRRIVLSAACAAMVSLSFVGFAKTIDVPLDGDIAAAVASAETGDVVQLAEGTYTLAAQVTIAKGITVRGKGRFVTTVVSDGTKHRLFYLDDDDAILSDLTVSGAVTLGGTAVQVNKGTFQDAIVRNCEGTDCYGGGVWLENGTVRRCVLTGNKARYGGGGLYTHGVCRVESVLSYGNTATWGGGLYVEYTSSATFVNCTFAENTTSSSGPDVYNYKTGTKCYNTYRGRVAGNSYGALVASPDSTTAPGFVSADSGVFLPAAGSALLGAGTTDVDGGAAIADVNGTPLSSTPSIGACQPLSGALWIVPASMEVPSGNSVDVTVNYPDEAKGGAGALVVIKPDGTKESVEVDDGETVAVAATLSGAHSLMLVVEKDGSKVVRDIYHAFLVGIGNVFVNPNSATPTEPYDEPEKAAMTIETALPFVMSGGTVWVSEGEYPVSATLTIGKGVTIRGAGSDKTVLAAKANVRLVSLNHAEAKIMNLALSGTAVSSDGVGKGVYFQAGGSVENCILENFNSTGNGGAATCAAGACGRVERCVFRSNTGKWGGAVYVPAGGRIDVRNSLFYGNTATWGAAVMTQGAGSLVNCTLVDNPMANVSQGEFERENNDFGVTNCIFGSVCWHSGSELNQSCNLGDGTALVDPGFRDRENHDYRPQAGAAAIVDQGDDSAVGPDETDLAGAVRISGGHVDLGCYEADTAGLLTVEGEPSAFGAVEPAYGSNDGYAPGQSVTCTASTYAVSAEGDLELICIGVKVLADGETIASKDFSDEEERKLTFDFPDCANGAKIVWTWQHYMILVKLDLPGGMHAEGDVTEKWVRPGEDAEFAVTLDEGCVVTSVTGGTYEDGKIRVAKVTAPVKVTVSAGHGFYVSTEGVDDEGRGGEEAPFKSIEYAYGKASGGDVIFVGEGTYDMSGSLALDAPVIIRGAGAEKTVLDYLSYKDGRAFTITNADAVVQGLTIKNCVNPDVGSGIYMTTGMVCGCIFSDCSFTGRGTEGGSAILMRGGTVTNCQFTRCVMRQNYGYGYGTAVYQAGGVLTDCLFTENVPSYYSYDGALFTKGGIVSRCIFAKNSFVPVRNEGATLVNCLIYGNVCNEYYGESIPRFAGIYQKSGKILNCTIAGNKNILNAKGCAGLWADGGTVANNIVWGNSAVDGTLTSFKFSNATVKNNVLDGEYGTAEDANISVDPMFADVANDDFRLLFGSPAMDKALEEFAPADDLDGVARPQRAGYDCGCYENVSTATKLTVNLVVSARTIGPEGAVTLIAAVDGPDLRGLEYSWTVDGEEYVPGSGCDSITLSNVSVGEHAVGLLVENAAGETAFVEDVAAFRVQPTVAFLSPTGSQTYPFDSWEKAATNLVEVLGVLWKAPNVTNELYFSEGTFDVSEEMIVATPCRFLGAGKDKTVLRASGSGFRCLSISNDGVEIADLTISGFVPTEGNGTSVEVSAGLVRNCRITRCSCQARASEGGGIRLSGSGKVVDCEIDNCEIRQPYGYAHGGGVYMNGGVLESCHIHDNAVLHYGYGEGLEVTGGSVRNCVIEGSFSIASRNKDAALYVEGSAVLVENCIVRGNTNEAVRLVSGTIRNTLAVGNSLNAADCRSVLVSGGTMYNCTIADNGKTDVEESGDLTVSGGTVKNTIAIRAAVTGGTADPAVNCFNEPVAFRNPGRGVYALTAGAVNCINKGDNSVWNGVAEPVDLDGKPRIYRDKTVDFGCYEFVPKGFVLSIR